MALVNAAVELAQNGRHVLAVDFDIESPGLDTFDMLKPKRSTLGIVDFVNQYLQTGHAPEVGQFVTEPRPAGDRGGSLAIMPSGGKKGYLTNFNQIDWNELYRNHDGYLLIEDLKEQWKREIKPDYVLIDSRTGYTDSSGICTRQLPDAVVALFFPNEQNLRGLNSIVKRIRSENKGQRGKTIQLHFVMSNVPDLDGEDQVLSTMINRFKKQLNISRDPIVIHHYGSLSLLNQAVFVSDRPKSRLAQQYKQLVLEVSAGNHEDRDGALEYMRRVARPFLHRNFDSLVAQDEMLERIERSHADDGQVLFRLAQLKGRHGGHDEASGLLVDQAIQAGFNDPEAYLRRSEFREQASDAGGAKKDLWAVLNLECSPVRLVREAISRLFRLGEINFHRFIESASVQSLSSEEWLWLANQFDCADEELGFAVELLTSLLESDSLTRSEAGHATHHLGLSLMGLGRFTKAKSMFRQEDHQLSELEQSNAFNYGMADWGERRTPSVECFEYVFDLHLREDDSSRFANYNQCLAITSWIIGKEAEANDFAGLARRLIEEHPRSEFSCWRYRKVSASVFKKDLDEMLEQFKNGDFLVPSVIAVSAQPTN